MTILRKAAPPVALRQQVRPVEGAPVEAQISARCLGHALVFSVMLWALIGLTLWWMLG